MAIIERPSPNHAARPDERIDTLVLHYTGMRDGPAAIARLCDPQAGVSAHYVVTEDGRVLRLVADERMAWHAGVSAWRGRSRLNATSIGIEIVNGGHDFGLPAYPARQIDAVTQLAHDLIARWAIPAVQVVGHSDVAPMRKRDPGELFPWSLLAAAGVGLWPATTMAAVPRLTSAGANVTQLLEQIGYVLEGAPQPTSVSAVLAAFQRRFAPHTMCHGRADGPTRRRLIEVAAAYRLASTATDA